MTPPRLLLTASCLLLIPTLPLRAADGFSGDGKRLRLNTGSPGYGFQLEASADGYPNAPAEVVDYIDFVGLGEIPFWTWGRTWRQVATLLKCRIHTPVNAQCQYPLCK